MKKIALVASALALLAGAASASSPNGNGERPGPFVPAAEVQTVQIPAGALNTPRELAQKGVTADTPIAVTFYAWNGQVAHTHR